MRPILWAVAVLTLTGIVPAFAAEDDPEITFLNAEKTRIELRRFDEPLSTTANECDSEDSCRHKYSIVYEGAAAIPPDPGDLPKVVVAHVDPNNDVLVLSLDKPLALRLKLDEEGEETGVFDFDDFRLVLRQIVIGGEEPQRIPLGLGPSVLPDLGSRKSIVYRSIERRTADAAPPKDSVKVTATDADKNKYDVTVTEVQRAVETPSSAGDVLWRIFLTPSLPRGTKLKVKVEGIDQYGGQALVGSSSIEVEDYPEGRDDATFYLRGEKTYDQLGDDSGSLDMKLEQSFLLLKSGLEWWYLIEATVGSKSLDVSQTGTASLGLRHWFDSQYALSFAPTFRTDRDFHDRDLGADIMFEAEPNAWFKTIDIKRRRDPENRNIHDGWWLKPRFGVEAGKHLASSSDEVEGETFLRGLGAINFLLETNRLQLLTPRDTVTLSVDFAARYLVEDEVTLDDEDVLEIGDGYKPYLRAELSYDIGLVALSAVHLNGKLPPTFKNSRTTTLGLTFKF
jgi:hypothetical protein